MRAKSGRGVSLWMALAGICGVGGLVLACGSSDSSGFTDNGGDEAGSGTGDDGGGGGGGGGPGGGFGKSEGGLDSGGGGGSIIHDANVDGGQCGASTQKVTALPLDLFIMLDTSGSMNNMVAQNVSKYAAVKTALTNFVNDAASAGIGVGIQFFPLLASGEPATCTTNSQCKGPSDSCFYAAKLCNDFSAGLFACNSTTDCILNGLLGAKCATSGRCQNDSSYICANVGGACGKDSSGFDLGACQTWTAGTCADGDSCVQADYANAAVGINTLPGNAAAIVTALNGRTPNGGTGTLSALQGAIQQAQARQLAYPDHTVAVVLATDGLPDECDPAAAALPAAQQMAKYVSDIQAVAAAGASGVLPIKTFVIGVFTTADAMTSKPNLDAIAMSGGTTAATIVTQGSNTTAQFQMALNSIKQTALPCSYPVPTPPSDGGVPDYSKVNVVFTSSTNTTTVIGNTMNASTCDPTNGGWYYDANPPAKPTKVNLCPATCNAVKNAAVGGHIDVVIGCEVTVTDAGNSGGGIH